MDENGLIPPQNGKWPQIERAMFLYYSGQARSLTEAAEMVEGLAKSTFYLYKEKYPEEFSELDIEIQALAVRARRAQELAFASEHLQRSIEAQRLAANAVLETLPKLVSLANGEVQAVTVTDEKGVTIKRRLVVYPRDQLSAQRLLIELAQDGLLTEHGRGLAIQQTQKEEVKTQEQPDALDIVGLVARDFRNVTATKEDGTVISATVRAPSPLIDLEPGD